MRIPLFSNLFILVLCLQFPLSAQIQLSEPVKFLALGDSYTIGQSVSPLQRWPAQLRDSLLARGYACDPVRVIATTGWRTDNLLDAIDGQNLENENYNLVSVLIGVNNQYQNRPFSQYEVEFPQLLDSAIRFAGGDTHRVFVVSIPDYAFTPFGQNSGNAVGISQQIDLYNAYNQQIAQQYGIRYYNITPISRNGVSQPGLVAGDGLHPSALQYTEWVKQILNDLDTTTFTSTNAPKIRSAVTVFPNPTQKTITVNLPLHQKQAIALLHTTQGTVLKKTVLLNPGSVIDIAGIPRGQYMLTIQHQNGQTTHTIAVE